MHRPDTPPPSPVPAIGQSKNWCFTLNNYREDQQEMLCLSAWDDCVDYMVFGREVGESGTPHLQGFVKFKNNKRFGGVQAFLPAGCHIEKCRGTAHEAAVYCKKDGDFSEFGSVPVCFCC